MIKKLLSLLVISCLVACATNDETINGNFNHDWNFQKGTMESNFQETTIEASQGWRMVSIPHDWSIEEGYSQTNTAGSNAFLPGGVGWYKKEFSLPKKDRDKNIFIRFEGVYNNAQVWINGHDLGNFPNGYLDFEYRLTPYIRDGKNDLTVRVDRRAYADARWYVGGGIYRPVHLIVRDDLFIPSHGQQISTSKLTASNAEVRVVTELQSDCASSQKLTIDYKLFCNDRLIATDLAKQNVTLNAKDRQSTEMVFNIENPVLWDLDSPQRYLLQTTIQRDDEVVIEQRKEYFGIRSAVFDAEKGFLLNGREVKIKGVNIHHDFGCLGVALYDKALYRRLKSLKDMGVNAIRTAHNPHSESLLAMCDTMGLLVMDEFVDEWIAVKKKWIVQRSMAGIADSLQNGYSQHFGECAERDIKSFVRRDYNHPSIILWSIGNEIEWSYPYYFASIAKKTGYTGLVFKGNHEANVRETEKKFKELSKGDDELARTAQSLSKWIKEVDKTRPVTSGIAIPIVSRISGYIDALDVVGYNYKDADYEADHKHFPEKSIIGSENVTQYFEWKAVLDKPYIPGIFIWTGIDYLGENGPWPSKGGHYSPFDFACFKTSRGHFFETLWNDAPKTHIVTTPASTSEFKHQADGSFKTEFKGGWLRKWLWFETHDKWSYKNGEEVVVQVYTNAPKAELFLNGQSLGVKNRADFDEENIILWQVPYSAGELVAVGLDEENKPVSRYALRTAGEIAEIKVNCDNLSIVSDGCDLAHIEIELLDKEGTRVCDDPREISIETDENTKILGVDNGSDTFVGSHKSNKIVTHNGRALVIVQPNRLVKGTTTIVLTTEDGLRKELTLEYRASAN